MASNNTKIKRIHNTSTVLHVLVRWSALNLYNPVYDATKCKEVTDDSDPWAREFLQNETAGFGPYKVKQLVRGQQAVFEAREDYYRGKPAHEDRDHAGSADLGGPCPAAAARRRRHRAVPAAAGVVSPKGAGGGGRTGSRLLLIWIELNAKIPPFDNVDVRRAMNYALPQDEVLSTVYQGLADADRLHAQDLPDVQQRVLALRIRTSARRTSCSARPGTATASRPR